MAPVTVEDIEARWRPLSDQESVNAQAFIADAWEELLIRRPELEANMTAGTVREGNVCRILAWAVRRVLINPEGWVQETLDDWTGRRSDLVAQGTLYFTDEELAVVTPPPETGPGVVVGRRHSVRLVRDGDA